MSSQQVIMTSILSKLKRTICITIKTSFSSFRENKQSPPRFLTLANFTFCLPPEIPRDIAFIPSVLERVPLITTSLNINKRINCYFIVQLIWFCMIHRTLSLEWPNCSELWSLVRLLLPPCNVTDSTRVVHSHFISQGSY